MQPDLILTPFGENADPSTIRTIPETVSPSDPKQNASWSKGFPIATMTAISAGGVPPEGKDLNGVLNAISEHTVFTEGGGQYKWSDEYVAAKGGYAKGSVLQSDNGENSYISVTDNNSKNFNIDPSSIGDQWVLYSDYSLRHDLSIGAQPIGYQSSLIGSVPSTLEDVADTIIDAVKTFGCDPTGVEDSSDKMLAFFIAAVATGKPSDIPPGRFSITPGVLDISAGWIDKAFPHIRTAGYGATTFVVRSDIDKPMIRINNGTATSATYRLWQGGSLGGIKIEDPFTSSTATNRHGLSIYGFKGTVFGYFMMDRPNGDGLHFERKLFGGTNPDPYNVAFCDFEGVECKGAKGWGINHDNAVGVTHCRFQNIRVYDGFTGGIRGIGVSSVYSRISIGNQRGDAFSIPFDTLVGGRTTIQYVEMDNCERGYDIETIQGLDVIESRIVHRYQTAPNTLPVYWPTTSFNISKTARNVSALNIKSFHRTEAGGPLSAIGTFYNFNNSTNVRATEIDVEVTDNGALGVTNAQLVTGLNGNSLDVVVRSSGKRIASTESTQGVNLRGASAVMVGTTGFASETAKIILPTEVRDTGNNYDPATGYFKVPYTAEYAISVQLVMTIPVGTRVRLGISSISSVGGSASYRSGKPSYADSASPTAHCLNDVIVLNGGDLVFIVADQNSGSPVPLSGITDATIENKWSIRPIQ